MSSTLSFTYALQCRPRLSTRVTSTREGRGPLPAAARASAGGTNRPSCRNAATLYMVSRDVPAAGMRMMGVPRHDDGGAEGAPALRFTPSAVLLDAEAVLAMDAGPSGRPGPPAAAAARAPRDTMSNTASRKPRTPGAPTESRVAHGREPTANASVAGGGVAPAPSPAASTASSSATNPAPVDLPVR